MCSNQRPRKFKSCCLRFVHTCYLHPEFGWLKLQFMWERSALDWVAYDLFLIEQAYLYTQKFLISMILTEIVNNTGALLLL